jgi:hypothetical protein
LRAQNRQRRRGLSATGSGSGASTATGSGSRGATAAGSALSLTFVPQAEADSSTMPLACSPSQATVDSGSTRVIVISPNAARWRVSASTSDTSAHSSGGDFTRVRWTSIASGLPRRGGFSCP